MKVLDMRNLTFQPSEFVKVGCEKTESTRLRGYMSRVHKSSTCIKGELKNIAYSEIAQAKPNPSYVEVPKVMS